VTVATALRALLRFSVTMSVRLGGTPVLPVDPDPEVDALALEEDPDDPELLTEPTVEPDAATEPVVVLDPEDPLGPDVAEVEERPDDEELAVLDVWLDAEELVLTLDAEELALTLEELLPDPGEAGHPVASAANSAGRTHRVRRCCTSTNASGWWGFTVGQPSMAGPERRG
jgi:hypothetical protein